MADLFGYKDQDIATPITADKCTINWGGIVTGAVQISINYAQQINRRRTIGNRVAAIWATMPVGQITIARLLTTNSSELFSSPGWKACEPGTLTFAMAGGCGGGASTTLTATGCIVTQFQVQAEAEGLTVMDNVTIEFLQLSA
jgi:hypothetical protein